MFFFSLDNEYLYVYKEHYNIYREGDLIIILSYINIIKKTEEFMVSYL